MIGRPANRHLPSGWRKAIGVSISVHAAVVLLLTLTGGEAPAKPLQHAIIAELVAKGEPQKKKELPRRVRTQRKKPGKIKPKPRKAVSKATQDTAAAALKRLDELAAGEEANDALARLGTQDQTGDKPSDAKGKAKGSDQGTLSQGELLTLQNNYLSQVGQAIKADGNYKISDTISSAERIRLSAILFLRIGRQGQLLEARLEQSSGHDQFDRDILSAARSASYPAPPKEIAQRLATGIRGTFRP